MSEKIKLQGSVGRGIHYIKQLVKPDGSPSNVYRLLTTLNYRTVLKDHNIGETINHIESVLPAGGPFIKVGYIMPEVNKIVKYIDEIPNFGIVITFEE